MTQKRVRQSEGRRTRCGCGLLDEQVRRRVLVIDDVAVESGGVDLDAVLLTHQEQHRQQALVRILAVEDQQFGVVTATSKTRARSIFSR